MRMPIPMSAAQREEPPYERKKRGIPVMGMIPIAIPILMITWKKIIAMIPEATTVPYLS